TSTATASSAGSSAPSTHPPAWPCGSAHSPWAWLMDYSNDGAIDHLVDLAHNDEECEREGDEDDRDEPDAPPRDPDDPSLPDDDSDPLAIPTWIHDPSGNVYEAVESNRLEGVTATLTQAPASDGPW